MPEPYHPISLNRYVYVYNSPVNLTDSTGHFIDTLWDVVDLGIDLSNCLGDSDTLSCYMLPVDVMATALPFASAGMADNAFRAARGVDDEVKTFYHGTGIRDGVNRTEYFEEGGTIFAYSDYGDYWVEPGDAALYTTPEIDEGVEWALRYDDPHLIQIDIPKDLWNKLKGVKIDPFEYHHGYKNTTELKLGGKLSRAAIEEKFGLNAADFLYGLVTDKPGYVQYAFKSPLAFEVLNASPRSIYRISNDTLQFVKRINPR